MWSLFEQSPAINTAQHALTYHQFALKKTSQYPSVPCLKNDCAIFVSGKASSSLLASSFAFGQVPAAKPCPAEIQAG